MKNVQALLPAVLLAALPLAVGASPTPAAAKGLSAKTEPVRVVVNHRDLDLTDPADVATLEARVRSSVKRVCPAQDTNLREMMRARQCRKTAAANAAAATQVAIATAHANRPQFASSDDKAVSAQ